MIVAGRRIGRGEPCFIIAEAGVNHNGSIERALELVDIAADAGADAVKFQTFEADRLATPDAPKADYQLETTSSSESQLEMLRRLELTIDQHKAIIARCEERGIIFLSTPFDEHAADVLESMHMAAFKTPSGELTNLPYIRHVASFGKPMIVSTGMATLEEVGAAVAMIARTGNDLVLLHCVSAYPAPAATINLRAMDTMQQTFGKDVGYSDHTMGIEITLAAVARGACVIEKHFTVSRDLPGPDHRASLEPDELRHLVRSIRDVESALGNGEKTPNSVELSTARVARKSLVAAHDIQSGSKLEYRDVVAMRPGTGISPAELDAVVGRTALANVHAGTLLTWEMLG